MLNYDDLKTKDFVKTEACSDLESEKKIKGHKGQIPGGGIMTTECFINLGTLNLLAVVRF